MCFSGGGGGSSGSNSGTRARQGLLTAQRRQGASESVVGYNTESSVEVIPAKTPKKPAASLSIGFGASRQPVKQYAGAAAFNQTVNSPTTNVVTTTTPITGRDALNKTAVADTATGLRATRRARSVQIKAVQGNSVARGKRGGGLRIDTSGVNSSSSASGVGFGTG